MKGKNTKVKSVAKKVVVAKPSPTKKAKVSMRGKVKKAKNGNPIPSAGLHIPVTDELPVPPSPKTPPIMAQVCLPGTTQPGPYARVNVPLSSVFEDVIIGYKEVKDAKGAPVLEPDTGKPKREAIWGKKRIRGAQAWVRVYQGDERNGYGIVVIPHNRHVNRLKRNQPVRWAGGTAETDAKLCPLKEHAGQKRHNLVDFAYLDEKSEKVFNLASN